MIIRDDVVIILALMAEGHVSAGVIFAMRRSVRENGEINGMCPRRRRR